LLNRKNNNSNSILSNSLISALFLLRTVSALLNFDNMLLVITAGIIVFAILEVGGVKGLAFIFYDMTAWGNIFSPEQFGLSGAFKFIDIEIILLTFVALTYYKNNSREIGSVIIKISKYIIIIGTIYSALSILYWKSDLGGVLRIYRTFLYASAIFFIPYYIKNKRDVLKLVNLFLTFAVINSIFYLAQILFPRLPIYQFASITRLETSLKSIRVYGTMLLIIIPAIPIFFAYLIQKKVTLSLKIVFIILLLAALASAGRTLLIITSLSFIIIIYFIQNRFKNIFRFVGLTIFSSFILLILEIAGLNIGGDIVERYVIRSTDIVSDINMGGGNFTMRALQLASVPGYLNNNERLIFGAGFQYRPPQDYGSISPFIYAFNYESGNYSTAGVLTRNVGNAANNELKVPIFFADNGWAGIFAAMGLLGLILYIIFILILLKFTYNNFKISKEVLTKSIFIGLFCMFLFDPVYFFFSAGYLDPIAMLHLVFFLSIAESAKRFELNKFEEI